MNSIGRYQLVEKLGQGGMGVVYRAFDTLLQRVVAVKVISGAIESGSEQRERFFREARAAGQLSHRNIITIHDLGEHDGQPYLAMEYLEGEDLQRRLTRPDRMSLARKIDLAIEVCEGLEFAHARGVIHRDIKPANIFITDNGTVKILDFGLARLVTSELTNSNMMMGTINYMAPEQVRGERADHRSDIFSVGVVLYELLSGRKAFEGESFATTLYRILQEEPESLLHIDPTLPPELVAIVERALAKPRDERYQNMSEMLRDLAVQRQQMAGYETPSGGRPASGGQARPSDPPQLSRSESDAPTIAHVPTPFPAIPSSGARHRAAADAVHGDAAAPGGERAGPAGAGAGAAAYHLDRGRGRHHRAHRVCGLGRTIAEPSGCAAVRATGTGAGGRSDRGGERRSPGDGGARRGGLRGGPAPCRGGAGPGARQRRRAADSRAGHHDARRRDARPARRAGAPRGGAFRRGVAGGWYRPGSRPRARGSAAVDAGGVRSIARARGRRSAHAHDPGKERRARGGGGEPRARRLQRGSRRRAHRAAAVRYGATRRRHRALLRSERALPERGALGAVRSGRSRGTRGDDESREGASRARTGRSGAARDTAGGDTARADAGPAAPVHAPSDSACDARRSGDGASVPPVVADQTARST